MGWMLRRAALSLALAAVASSVGPADDEFRWETDLDAARQQAAELGRPLLIVFR